MHRIAFAHYTLSCTRVNANLKMSIFAETECHFSAVSVEVYTALIHNLTCRLEPRQALIYQLVLGLTGENDKYNYSRAVHLYPPFFDITCSAKNYKIAPALTLYQRKDISYKELTAQARTSLRELVRQMENTICDSPVIEMQMVQLVGKLRDVKGKKQYGYLKKPIKEQVDAIVDELAKVPQVAECFEIWNRLRDELESYYKDAPRQHLPLSQQKEFKAIKNMVIQEAESLRLGVLTFEDNQMADEPPDNTRFRDPDLSNEDKRSVIEMLERDWEDGGSASIAYQLGRIWRDGLGVIPDDEKAEMWFQRAAGGGHCGAQYALAKFLHEQGRINDATPWYEQAAEGGNPFAGYQLGKLCLSGKDVPKDVTKAVKYLTDAAEQDCAQAQYILGKLYLLGRDVEQDYAVAECWLIQAAGQGHAYAQFFLNHIEQDRDPSALLCAPRLLCSMAQIIRDTPPPAPPGIHIDRKRFQQLMEKKIAMGHKPDDHEEQNYIGPAM